MSTAVEFDNVSIVFGDRPWQALALMDQGLGREEIKARTGQILGTHDCSLTVAEGEILVLMGLSGSGKSTLLRAVNGLAPVTRGAVRLRDGADMVSVTGADAARLRHLRLNRVAMVFQQFGLLPWRTVAGNVGLGLELAGIGPADRARRVEEQLALVGLEGWGCRRLEELSGGMQQRVGLARAFATQAPLLLMDEPFSALDPLIRARLQDDLLDIQGRMARTLIFVSHDLDEAFKLGDRIALMDGGRLVQIGTPREIIARPANAHVADFVARINPLNVLTARDLMGAGTPGPGAAVPPDMPVRAVMSRLAAGAEDLAVVEDGRVLGVIRGAEVLARLLTPGG